MARGLKIDCLHPDKMVFLAVEVVSDHRREPAEFVLQPFRDACPHVCLVAFRIRLIRFDPAEVQTGTGHSRRKGVETPEDVYLRFYLSDTAALARAHGVVDVEGSIISARRNCMSSSICLIGISLLVVVRLAFVGQSRGWICRTVVMGLR